MMSRQRSSSPSGRGRREASGESPRFREVSRREPAESRGDLYIFLIGLFKLIKAGLLIATGIGLLRLLHKDVAEVIERWIDILRVDPDNQYVHEILVKAFRLNDRTLKQLSAGTFVYAALFLIEGTGLLLRKRWAEYFTIAVTASLLPLEFYELLGHPTLVKTIVIIVNAAIVAYLVLRVRSKSHART